MTFRPTNDDFDELRAQRRALAPVERHNRKALKAVRDLAAAITALSAHLAAKPKPAKKPAKKMKHGRRTG
jgi:hypothetical protein